MKNKRFFEEKGITLIALIITIIVLLILAAISISTLIQSGVIENAKHAEEQYRKAGKKETLELEIAAMKAEALSKNKNLTLEDVFNNLSNKLDDITRNGDFGDR